MKLPSIRGRSFHIPTNQWSDIQEFYSRWERDHGLGEEMVDLVRHIRSQAYADRLYAFTSVSELIIGLYPELERGTETLHVTYDEGEELYRLKYFATPTRKPEVDKTYLKKDGLKKFDDLIGYLKW